MNKTSAVQTIGILTSGGDAPGMNAAIRAVVRSGCEKRLPCNGNQKRLERSYAW